MKDMYTGEMYEGEMNKMVVVMGGPKAMGRKSPRL